MGWEQSASRNGRAVWTARLPPELTGASTPRQLYVDGVRAARTSGNASQILGNITDASPTPLTAQSPRFGGLRGYSVSKTTLTGWKNPADIELV